MKSDFNSVPASNGVGVRLTDLAPGGEAFVLRVDESTPTGRRLLDLGLLPRTRIKMIRRAPLGDPTLYELRGYRLCLRAVDAARVEVTPTLGPPTGTEAVEPA